ncbi:MAG TPA: aminotransferase class V-fold PLP-dependent enzyme [Candidatus Deferrimicrobium sp.]|nr:aminotransferase class V-fold PLP-dependent enzyme [Candidatus Deferrimicrobium sp.]
MTKLIDNAFDPEIFRKNGHALVNQLADYLNACKNKEDIKPLPWQTPADMLKKWQTNFTAPSEKGLSDFFAAVIADSLHLHHPKYIGHQVAPPAPLAALTDLLSALLNNSQAVYEVGPLSAALEKIVMGWTASVLGMGKEAGGILTSGGSIGNLTGLLAARQHQADYNTWEEGTKDTHPMAVMVSAEAHYSVSRAVKIMGWGEKGIIKIPLNKRKEIDPHMLEQCYQDAIRQGKRVLAVVGNACSTSTGSYDPLEEIAAFCRDHQLWFHVDGAHGAGAVLTEKYRHLVKGIEKADSVVIDFHKMLLCPALTTAVIFKNDELSHETFSQKASYLLANEKKENWFDIAAKTLECTKKMMSVKIYTLLRTYGPQLFSDYITGTYDLAGEFAKMIKESGDFELALEPASNIVCFRYAPYPLNTGELDELNTRVRNRIKEDGEFYIVQTVINGAVYLRSTLMNPFTSADDLLQLLQKIRSLFPPVTLG